MLANENNSSFGSQKLLLGTPADIRGVKRNFDKMESPVTVSLVGGSTPKITPMPVKAAQVTETWLQTVISPLPSKPSARLEQMLVVHGKSIVDEVIKRPNIIMTALFPSTQLEERILTSLCDINLMESLWSEQKCSEALKLYYRVLESICSSETQKSNFGGLLANERFHRGLLACSAELVSAAQTGISMLLPVVFERTGITAFDLSKVIESLIIYEPTLPRELRRHLNSLEEQLLESRVWENGSALYDSLITARPDLYDDIYGLELLAAPLPSLDTIASHNLVSSGGFLYPTIQQKHKSSPVQYKDTICVKSACGENGDEMLKYNSPAQPKQDHPLASPSSQNPFMSPTESNRQHVGDACSDTAINILFRKMEKLAAIRIQSIADKLKLSHQFRKKIYFFFQQILIQRTILFFNRHMDQIILCCFYGLAKVYKLELTFKQIINTYMKQPQCRSQVYCFVSSTHGKNGEQYVDIMKFHNKIFIPTVKSLLDKIRYAEKQVPEIRNNGDSPPLHQMSPFSSLPDISPKKVSPSQNVYLSPLQPSKKEALNSNLTKSYYAFVGESTQPYQSPSKQLSDINECLKRKRKVRCRLNFDSADVVMISDEVAVKSLHL